MRPPRLRPAVDGNPASAAMTPMIDVVFLLLVFFLCASSFDRPEQNLAASLAVADNREGAGADTPPPELEEITVAARYDAGRTSWAVNDGAPTADLSELQSLLRRLAAVERSLPVTIDARPDVPMGDVVAAYDAARAAGFGRVVLAADALPESTERPDP